MRTTFAFVWLLGLSISLLCIASSASQLQVQNAMLVDAGQPAVYITFERFGKRTPVRSGESGEGVWLRMHNNTKLAISLCTQGLYIGEKVSPLKLATGKDVLALRNGAEVSVCYDVDEQKPNNSNPPGHVIASDTVTTYQRSNLGTVGHVSSLSWIPSGQSVVIDLPREHLSKGFRIGISFNFEWETNTRNLEHTVHFYASDLGNR